MFTIYKNHTHIRAITFIMLLVSTLLSIAVAQASLLISPTRIAFNERDRVQTVTLINSGQDTRTYRLGWTQQRVNQQGGYELIPEGTYDSFPIASPYIRFTPRQVTLEPGERQTIKLMARRSKDMDSSEYRSHLDFIVLPNETKNASTSEGLSMRLNLLLSYSIPIILKTKKPDATINIDSIVLNTQPDRPLQEILVTFSREGSTSVTGNIQAYFTPSNSQQEVQVGTLNGFNFFPDTQAITKKVIRVNDINLQDGKLRVSFEGAKEFSGQLLAKKEVRIKAASPMNE